MTDLDAGDALAREGTAEAGPLTVFDGAHVGLDVEVLDGWGVHGSSWVFIAFLTDIGVEITLTDSATGASQTNSSPEGTPSSGCATSRPSAPVADHSPTGTATATPRPVAPTGDRAGAFLHHEEKQVGSARRIRRLPASLTGRAARIGLASRSQS